MTEQRYAEIMLTGQASGCTVEEAAEALERYRAALRRSLAPRGMPVVVHEAAPDDVREPDAAPLPVARVVVRR